MSEKTFERRQKSEASTRTKKRNVKIVFEWIETKINVRSAPV